MRLQPIFLPFLLLPLLAGTCAQEDTIDPNAPGTVEFEITDAPILDDDIRAVYVTVAGVQVGEQRTDGGKVTLDLLDLQDGNTFALGSLDLDPGSYERIELVLDYETTSGGESPGCYVETTDGTRHELTAIVDNLRILQDGFDLSAGELRRFVVDFDVRKAVIRQLNNPDDCYDFGTTFDLRDALRHVEKSEAATLTGTLAANGFADAKTVVYAYRSGKFDFDEETEPQPGSTVRFAQAVTSAPVRSDGSFSLHFLPADSYELHFFTYREDADQPGQYELSGQLEAPATEVRGLQLTPRQMRNVTVGATGVIPL